MMRPLRIAARPRAASALCAAAAVPALVCSLSPQPQPAATTGELARDVVAARAATAKYVMNLGRARANGYRIITRMIPDMGWHFMNSSVQGFNIRRPPILVYERRGGRWQLGALEWVFTSRPKTPPLPGARYGSFAAACHYADGTFVAAGAESACAPRSPQTGAKFTFWHPNLVTMHLWIWYPNPSGLFSSMNPLVRPFNDG
jgi:hypothetical protein